MVRSRSSASDPWSRALQLLNRRDLSEVELRTKLEMGEFSSNSIDETVQRCCDYGYLDDRRYALERARSLLRNGRGVGRKILLDLQRRGIDSETAEWAISEASREFQPAQILHQLLDRRFPGFNDQQADQREKRRVVGFLQRRGYSLGEIFQAFRERNAAP